MKTYKTLMITCVGLLASASSLAAWSYGNNQQNSDYEPADGYYSEPYYRGSRVSEENDDERAMGPYYNNGNQYNYNKNPVKSPSNTPKQTQGENTRPISMNGSARSQFINGTGYISLNETTHNVGDRVRSAIQKDTALSSNARAVLVTADANGQVTISGSVASAAEKSKVESLVKSVEGVRGVKNNITIQNHK